MTGNQLGAIYALGNNIKTYHDIFENFMVNLYNLAKKVILINPLWPPYKNVPYTALFYHTMTLISHLTSELHHGVPDDGPLTMLTVGIFDSPRWLWGPNGPWDANNISFLGAVLSLVHYRNLPENVCMWRYVHVSPVSILMRNEAVSHSTAWFSFMPALKARLSFKWSI